MRAAARGAGRQSEGDGADGMRAGVGCWLNGRSVAQRWDDGGVGRRHNGGSNGHVGGCTGSAAAAVMVAMTTIVAAIMA